MNTTHVSLQNMPQDKSPISLRKPIALNKRLKL